MSGAAEEAAGEEGEAVMDKRMNDHVANMAWLEGFLKTVTGVDLVVEYVPEKRAGAFDFGFGMDPEALYRVTLKGIAHTPLLGVARVALRDEEHIRKAVEQAIPKPEPEPEKDLH